MSDDNRRYPDSFEDEPERLTGRQAADEATRDAGRSIADVEADLAAMRDNWMRSEAEIVNVRKRAQRELDSVREYAIQKFATDVVDAADNLRRGIESIPPPYSAEPEILTRLRLGFVGVENSFVDLLKRNGVVSQDPTGAAFNPAVHQAMSQAVTSGQPPGTIVQALTTAWTLNGRLLKPAMVVVAKGA